MYIRSQCKGPGVVIPLVYLGQSKGASVPGHGERVKAKVGKVARAGCKGLFRLWKGLAFIFNMFFHFLPIPSVSTLAQSYPVDAAL